MTDRHAYAQKCVQKFLLTNKTVCIQKGKSNIIFIDKGKNLHKKNKTSAKVLKPKLINGLQKTM